MLKFVFILIVIFSFSFLERFYWMVQNLIFLIGFLFIIKIIFLSYFTYIS